MYEGIINPAKQRSMFPEFTLDGDTSPVPGRKFSPKEEKWLEIMLSRRISLEEKRRLVQAGVRGRKGGKSRTELAIGILDLRKEPGADIDADSPPAVRDDGVLALLLAGADRP